MSHLTAVLNVTEVCPSCQHEVLLDYLCDCADCGSLYCGLAVNNCKGICPVCTISGPPERDDYLSEEEFKRAWAELQEKHRKRRAGKTQVFTAKKVFRA